jgi:hypothetical protein
MLSEMNKQVAGKPGKERINNHSIGQTFQWNPPVRQAAEKKPVED